MPTTSPEAQVGSKHESLAWRGSFASLTLLVFFAAGTTYAQQQRFAAGIPGTLDLVECRSDAAFTTGLVPLVEVIPWHPYQLTEPPEALGRPRYPWADRGLVYYEDADWYLRIQKGAELEVILNSEPGDIEGCLFSDPAGCLLVGLWKPVRSGELQELMFRQDRRRAQLDGLLVRDYPLLIRL
jgi:hypothetical protein